MSINRASFAALIGAGMIMSSAAMAQPMADTGWYVGGSFGQSEVKDFCDGLSTCDDKDSAWKIFGGYHINRNFAIELGYADLGEVSGSVTILGVPSTATAEATAWELVGIGSVPLANQFSIFGKIGLYRAETDVGGTGFFGAASETNTDLTFGLGVRYDFSRNLGLRAEWQRYSDVGGGDIEQADIDVLSIGVIWRF